MASAGSASTDRNIALIIRIEKSGQRIVIRRHRSPKPFQFGPLIWAGKEDDRPDIGIVPPGFTHHHEAFGLVWPRHFGQHRVSVGRCVDRDEASMVPVQRNFEFLHLR